VLAKVSRCAIVGLDGAMVDVEVDISNGQPQFTKVGSETQMKMSSLRQLKSKSRQRCSENWERGRFDKVERRGLDGRGSPNLSATPLRFRSMAEQGNVRRVVRPVAHFSLRR
jgi:hypothetical protein